MGGLVDDGVWELANRSRVGSISPWAIGMLPLADRPSGAFDGQRKSSSLNGKRLLPILAVATCG